MTSAPINRDKVAVARAELDALKDKTGDETAQNYNAGVDGAWIKFAPILAAQAEEIASSSDEITALRSLADALTEDVERLQIDNDIKAVAVRDQQAQITAQAETIKSLSEALQFVMDNGYIEESEHIAQAALSKALPVTGEQSQ